MKVLQWKKIPLNAPTMRKMSWNFFNSSLPEFKIEMQWVYSQEALEFPDSSMLDTNGRPARESGFVKLPLETVNAANATGATGKFWLSAKFNCN